MLETKDTIQEELKIQDILPLFEVGCKPPKDHRVGIEFERLPVSSKDFKAVGYEKENGIHDLLRSFARLDCWEYITDDYNIVGLKKNEDKVTLEPGCQLELSFEPQKNIADIKEKVDLFNKKITPLLRRYDINLLQYGISPVSTYKNINLIPKKRYHIMANYLWGILSDVMMRETAGIQACFDFSSQEDAIRKFKLANQLSPFMTAMFANSPIRGGVDTGYKTFRGLSWLNTDTERCGFASKKLFESKSDYSFEEYIKDVMKSPMIFIVRNDKPIKISGKIDFEQFMKHGFEDYVATLDDFKLHANLYFPEVRLRKFIEIRNHDCVNHNMQYAILAIYKGILYNKRAMEDAEELMSIFTFNDMMEFRYNVPKHALDAKVKRRSARDISKNILKIALNGLCKNGEGEEKFLDPILELNDFGLCPADVILSNWNGPWNRDIKKMMKYLEG